MSDNMRIDSHKLIYHPERTSRWMKDENIYPIELEISPSGACNHRCSFCAFDYVGYDTNYLDKGLIINTLKEIFPKGLKSVIYSGEGEPLLNKHMSEILNKSKEIGIDSALSSNGVLFDKKFAEETLHTLKWIRFSVAGVTPSVYSKIHGTKEQDIDKVLNNLSEASKIKKEKGLKTTLGSQLLLIPENLDDVVNTAKALKKTHIDYFSVKPYSKHSSSLNSINIDYNPLLELEKELREIETDNFKIIFRSESMQNAKVEKKYDKCYGLPFFAHVDAKGNILPCCNFVGKNKLSYGNLYEKSFINIWESKKRKKVIEIMDNLNLNETCRELCRNNEINKYLYELKNPSEHVNFI